MFGLWRYSRFLGRLVEGRECGWEKGDKAV